MKYVLKAMKATVIVLALFVFILSAFIMLGSIFKDEKQLSPWGTGFFTLITGSMEPSMPAGSLVFVVRTNEEKINPGDVITYFTSWKGDVITHRVTEIIKSEKGRRFITRGDANSVDDPSVIFENVIGRVMFSVPGIKSFGDASEAAKIAGMSIIGIGGVLLVFGLINGMIKKTKTLVGDRE